MEKLKLALKESEQRFKSVFDNAADGFLIADIKTKKFLLANPMIKSMLGYASKELLSLGVMDIHPKQALQYVLDQFDKQISGDISIAANIPLRRKDGTVFYTDVNSFRLILDGRSCLCGIFRDITKHKEIEEDLQLKGEQLQKYSDYLDKSRSALLNILEDVEEANKELKTLDLMKDRLMMDVSHELKTPVTSLQMSIELLRSELNKTIRKENLEDIYDMLNTNILRLQDTIDEILDMSILTQGKMKWDFLQFDFNLLIVNVIAELSQLADKKSLRLVYTAADLPLVTADKNKIRRVLINLIGNAIKFNTCGEINIACLIEKGSFLVSIKDSGIGLPGDQLEVIFNKFSQVDPSSVGPGLGLTISQAIIKKHKGKIWAESAGLGKGSCFRFTLPLRCIHEKNTDS
ncbi:MAG: PAS domain-containing sensor histidine kinase [Nanoarchaeota archaeon]